jgi:hypothetical protein
MECFQEKSHDFSTSKAPQNKKQRHFSVDLQRVMASRISAVQLAAEMH